MSVRKAYTDWSTTYDTDRNLTRDLDAVVTRATLSRQHYRSILELGCGTGKNTSFYAQIGERVCALDFSEGMILRAKEKVQRGNVTFAVADLTRPWPCATAQFDLAVCNLVLEHVADLGPVFLEAYRVLAQHGCFFISELHPFKQYQGKKAVFQRDQQQNEIPAFVHPISNFLDSANSAGFALKSLREWWHEADRDSPPRLVSFVFEK